MCWTRSRAGTTSPCLERVVHALDELTANQTSLLATEAKGNHRIWGSGDDAHVQVPARACCRISGGRQSCPQGCLILVEHIVAVVESSTSCSEERERERGPQDAPRMWSPKSLICVHALPERQATARTKVSDRLRCRTFYRGNSSSTCSLCSSQGTRALEAFHDRPSAP